jgi:hypothetical protein
VRNPGLPKAIQAVAAMIDAELLRQLESPDDSQARTELLAKQVESLKAQHERARKRFLTVEDDDLARELQADLMRMQDELEEAQRALHMAKAVKAEGGIIDFAAWWKEKKPILMAVAETVSYADGRTLTRVSVPGLARDPQAEVVDARPYLGWEETKNATDLKVAFVPFDLDEFRGLLTRLGLKLVCRWQEAARRQGNGRHELAEVTVGIDVNHTLPHTSAKRIVAGCTGTCSPRAFTTRRAMTRRTGSAAAGSGRSCACRCPSPGKITQAAGEGGAGRSRCAVGVARCAVMPLTPARRREQTGNRAAKSQEGSAISDKNTLGTGFAFLSVSGIWSPAVFARSPAPVKERT